MNNSVRFDRWWSRILAVLVVMFVAWFVYTQRDGFIPLLELILDAVSYIPTALASIIAYYGEVSPDALLASFAIGALFGSAVTGILYVRRGGWLRLPRVRSLAWIIALLVAVLGFMVGLSILVAAALGLVVLPLAAYIAQDDMREAINRSTFRRLTRRDAQSSLWRGVLFGAVAGGFGAQLLNLPTQHCAYAPAADVPTVQIGLVLTLVSALILLVPLWTLTNRRRDQRRVESHSGFFQGNLLPLLLLSPMLLSLILFLYYPSIQIAEQSLTRVRRGMEPRFVCMENFVELAQDTVYQNSFLTTFGITAAIVVLTMTLALLISLLAAQRIKGAAIYRTLLIWPYALSPVVTGAIFISMFRDDRSGLINYALYSLFDVNSVNWLTDPQLAPWVVVAASVYNAIGFNVLFYIAGLQNIPRDLMEAAQIDGANVFQRFLRITIPMLSPFTFFLLVANITYSFYGIYGVIDTLFPGGGPLMADGESKAVNVLIYKLYEDSFRSVSQLGEAAAQSIILFILVAGITLIQFRYVENRVVYAD